MTADSCDDIIVLKVKVATQRQEIDTLKADVKDLLAFKSEINTLVKLGIGGGALSIINLAITLLQKVT